MIFEYLTEKDKIMISEYINNHAGIKDKENRAPLNVLLAEWDANKQNLYKLLGNKFIHEVPVTIEEPIDDIIVRMSDLKSTYRAFLYDLEDKYHSHLRNSNHYSWEYSDFTSLVNNTTLAENKINYKAKIYLDKDIVINNGMKPLKVLKMICEYFDADMNMYEEFRIKHSQALNTKKITGTLCLSIHPMDYMTMSDNNEGWSSCMSWCEDGGYRRGTIECMNSEQLLVAYLRSDTETFEGWNSKKWRTLIAVHDSIMVTVKGYPYQHAELNKIALTELYKRSDKDKWYDAILHMNNEGDIEDSNFITQRTLNFNIEYESVMYNDFSSTHHFCCIDKTLYEEFKNAIYDRSYDISIGGSVTCMQCGEIDCNYYHEGKLICSNCTPTAICSICGDRVETDHMVEAEEGLICSYCYEDNYSYCAIPRNEQNMNVHTENVIHISILPKGFTNREDIIPRLGLRSTSCLADLWKKDPDTWHEYFKIDKPHQAPDRWDNNVYYVNWEEVTEKGFEAFYLTLPKEKKWYNNSFVRYINEI